MEWSLVRVVAGRAELLDETRAVEIWEPPHRVVSGQILLVVGGSAEDCLAETVRASVEPVVIVTREGATVPIDELPAGILLLQKSPDFSWGELYTFFQRFTSRRDDGRGAADALPGVELGQLDRVAEAMADLLGGPVIIEGPDLEVLAYSSYMGPVDKGRNEAILGRRMPLAWVSHLSSLKALERLLTHRTVVDVVGGPQRATRRLIASVHEHGVFLGLVWVAEGAQPLPPDVEERIARAAYILQPHLAYHQAERAGQTRDVRRRLQGLFESGGDARAFLVESGLEGASSFALIALRRADLAGFREREGRRVVDSALLYLRSSRFEVATVGLGGAVYAVLGALADASVTPRDLLVEMAEVLERIVRAPLHIASSNLFEVIGDLPEVKAELDEALALLGRRSYKVSRQLDAREAALELGLDSAVLAARDRMRGRDPLASLAAHDQQHGSDLVSSLVAYLAAGQSVSEAARALHVHPTTLRYRLGRVAEVTGYDLGEPSEVLVLGLLAKDRVSWQ